MNDIEYAKILANYIFNTVFDGISRTMKLNRKRYSGTIDKISKEVSMGAYDINMFLNFDEYNDIILEFKEILDVKLSHCHNNAFYQNIKDLILEEYDTLEQANMKKKTSKNVVGSYNVRHNMMKLYNIKERDKKDIQELKRYVTLHELLHMASSYKKGAIKICGFHQKIGLSNIGRGLNEGYTKLLLSRYFYGSEKTPIISYTEEQLLAIGIEEIVGKEKMEKLYFAGDLKSLITEISQFTTIDEIRTIIENIDKCTQNRENEYEYENIAGQTRTLIANIQLKKYNHLFREGKITSEEYNDEKLRIEFYVKGYILNKNDSHYICRDLFHNETMLSKDCYRLTKKHFLETQIRKSQYLLEDYNPRIYDIPHYAEEIQTRAEREKINLSNIDEVKIEKNGFGVRYIFISKDQKQTTDLSQLQLNEMFNSGNSESLESKKVIQN